MIPSRNRLRATGLAALIVLSQLAFAVPGVAANEDVDPVAEAEVECVQPGGGFTNICESEDGELDAFGPPANPTVAAAVATFTWTDNMTPLGYSARNVTTGSQYNSDLAFWGDYAFQGHYDGFRIIDISNPENPVQTVNVTGCGGNAGQGDLVVWDNILVRSWDAPSTGNCGGSGTGTSFEGLNFFDVSNKSAPVFLGNLRMASNSTPSQCGSHTNTILPDVARGNLYMYVGASTGTCPGIDIVRVPIANPAAAQFVRREPSGRSCHDNFVALAGVNRIVCAGGNGFTVWSVDPSLDAAAVGGFEDPVQLRSTSVSGVTIGHSATITYDGQVMVFGHEPGGGSAAQCQATSSLVNRSLYFYNLATGALLGSVVHARPQTSNENCTWHNFNVIPTNRGYALVTGNYQMGIGVWDFTNIATGGASTVQEIAFADPARLSTSGITLGGDWSSYWYNGHIYESDIRRGLIIWKLDHRLAEGTVMLPHSNPQTMLAFVDRDLTAPTTTASLSPAPVNGWYSTNPTVTLTATDGPDGAGIDITEYNLDGGGWTTYTGPFVVSGDGSHTLEYRSRDLALNLEATNTLNFQIDVTDPDITLTLPEDAPTQAAGDPGNYALGSSHTVDFTCTDATSGVATCLGSQPNGAQLDTSTVGFHTFTVVSTDNAGNTTSVTHTYNVYWPGWSDFYQPIANSGWNAARATQAVPVKFSLGGDFGLGIFADGYPATRQVSCDDGSPLGPLEPADTAGNSSLTYDGQYVYVLKTEASWAGTCRELVVKLIDNTVHTALFRFR